MPPPYRAGVGAYRTRPSFTEGRPTGLSRDIASLPRALSKLGFCSRTDAARLIEEGRVEVDGRRARDLAQRVDLGRSVIRIDGAPIKRAASIYLMINKPRGLVTTRNDPQQRGTVYDCLDGLDLPFVAPVGRLDKASEGLLLMTNDTGWAERLLNPASNILKHYHVQIDRRADSALLAALEAGVEDKGETLIARSATVLRDAPRTSWLEIVLDEGRNRQIRRLLNAQGAEVLRLVRVAVGGVELGDLAKGAARPLTARQIATLSRVPGGDGPDHMSRCMVPRQRAKHVNARSR